MKIQGSTGSEASSTSGPSPFEFLQEHGFTPDVEPSLDGKLRRFTHNCGDGKAGWAVFHSEPFPRGKCGCHRCGINEKWNGLGRELTDEEKKAIDKLSKAREAEALARQESLSAFLEDILLPKLQPATAVHPVCEKKGVKPHGAFQKMMGEHPVLLVVLRDINWKAWSLQGIATEPIPQFGNLSKSYEKGGRINGCFAPIGISKGEKPQSLLICEGWATGATLHEATGLPVLCAMQANNLVAVAKAARSKWPGASIVVCADNDRHTAGNPGVEAAESAALCTNSGLAIPDFGADAPAAKNLTDFNDLAREKGRDAVAAQVLTVVPPEPPSIFFEAPSRQWWKRSGGIYVPYNEGGIKRVLHISGMARSAKGDNPSPIDLELERILSENVVDYAGPVAGWKIGVHRMGNNRVLVTKPCELLEGANIAFPNLEKILLAMLGPAQTARLLLWLRVYRDRIRSGKWSPLPIIVFVGPKSSGKSMLQEIITISVGGRAGKPMQYMLGDTIFNAELIGCEHLMIEDETSRGDAQSRRQLGEKIKEMFFARRIMSHKKNGTPITLEPLWGLSMSINDEPEHIMVLPTIDRSLSDKLLILKVEPNERPVPEGMLERDWVSKMLEEEVPGFVFYADNFDLNQIPRDFRDDRSIVAGWQHPAILSMLVEQATETHFFALVEDVLFGSTQGIHSTWRGTAEDLSRKLRDSDYRRDAEKLLSWPSACGVYLGRAMTHNPTRIRRERTSTKRTWVISPPGFDVANC